MENKKNFVSAIILAAGSGSRMGADVTKQKLEILGESILHRCVKAFSTSDDVDSITVVVREDEIDWAKEQVVDLPKIHNVVSGGKNRAESAFRGFSAIDERTDFVAIHDAARCLVTSEIIRKVVSLAIEKGAATASTAVTDTLKFTDVNGVIRHTVLRDGMFSAQTPQVFSRHLYARALEGVDFSSEITDDNMLIELLGEKVFAVETGKENIKITTPADVGYAEYIIKRRSEMAETRFGHGYDVHRLVEGRKLVLGGVEIPHNLGLLGHSDADVLTHAVMDAILGACALGDIGRHFPDTSSEYKDISSLALLKRVMEIIKKEGFSIVNIDATLVLQKPKIAPYVEKMIDNYVEILQIERGRINIKATTEEKLGFTGNEEGAAAYAVAAVKKG